MINKENGSQQLNILLFLKIEVDQTLTNLTIPIVNQIMIQGQILKWQTLEWQNQNSVRLLTKEINQEVEASTRDKGPHHKRNSGILILR